MALAHTLQNVIRNTIGSIGKKEKKKKRDFKASFFISTDKEVPPLEVLHVASLFFFSPRWSKTNKPNTYLPLFSSRLDMKNEAGDVQLVSFCNFTARSHYILQTGPLREICAKEGHVE